MSTTSTASARATLSRVSPALRRHAAGGLAAFAALFAVVAVLAALRGGAALIAVAVIVAMVAVGLALAAWGLLHGIRAQAAEERVDSAIAQALAEHDATCGCGHQHDPDELRVTDREPAHPGDRYSAGTVGHAGYPDSPCAQAGAGTGCAHDCAGCVLAAGPTPAPAAARSAQPPSSP